MRRLARFRFRGATAVVTGAASGIGAAVAAALAERGAHLVLLDRDAEGLRTVAAMLRSTYPGVEVGTICVDLADPVELGTVASGIRAAHPRVDLLVNNAGIALGGFFEQMSLDDFYAVLDVNLLAPVRLTHHLLPALLARPGGHVVNVSSIFGITAPPGQTAYSASKFGLRGFSESLRSELLLHGVGVTTVHPGGIATAIARNARSASGVRDADLAAGREAFDRLLRIPPSRAAELIVRAVERRKPRLLIGASARMPDLAARLAPSAHQLAYRPILRRFVEGQAPQAGNDVPRNKQAGPQRLG